MGLLDDAIREHLDLKRRRGGDPTEVARLEQEALGPVRREPEPPARAEERLDAQDPAHHGAVAEEPPQDDAQESPQQEERLFEAPEPAAEESAPVAAAEAPPVEPGPEPDSRHDDDLVHQPTTEYRVEDHHDDEDEDEDEAPEAPAAHGDADEDVLEETPDFLQETPEHDRLWFEQRPPRDFDFDG